MDNLNRNIKYLMQKHDINNVTELAKRVRMRQSTLHRVFTGEVKDPKYTTLKQIADYFGVSAIELIECDLQKIQPTTIIDAGGDYFTHKFTDVLVRNDIVITESNDVLNNKENVENNLYLRWPSYDNDVYAVKCIGSSMTPRIKAGEFVVIEPNHSISSGDEVLIITDGKVTVKTFLFERDEDYHLLPINEDAAPIRTPKSAVEALHYVAGIAKPDLIKK
ncbi:XRE family transcriptional regulator [Xenorhabdus bovienii]|nr:XRE family transcriptional regulator [Xenorhabdus bovienii]